MLEEQEKYIIEQTEQIHFIILKFPLESIHGVSNEYI